MNNLKSEKSSYLKSAAHQPVNWYPWCNEVFDIAKQKDFPVLLDIGAVWCHWCHVMDNESYEDSETARIINENFLPIKVDRDERPDIDARYQKAVNVFTGNGGWPLTAFLTYDGYFFYGGTYFPNESKYGLPSFKTVLSEISKYYKENKKAILSQSMDFYDRLFKNEKQSNLFPFLNFNLNNSINLIDASLNNSIIKKLTKEACEEFKTRFDGENGGLDEAPKFYYFSTLDLLFSDYLINSNKDSLEKGLFTIKKMALGGVFDQVGGGFHRYSTDKKWIIPHFEKLASDNAIALRIYAKYYRLANAGLLSKTAETSQILLNVINKTLDFIRGELYDRINGGFYSSVDADVLSAFDISNSVSNGMSDRRVNIDDGSFFTWTIDEFKEVFTSPDELEEAVYFFNLGKDGVMHSALDNVNNNSPFEMPNVLYLSAFYQQNENLNEESLQNLQKINHFLMKLKDRRDKRKKPFIDKAKYSSVNGNIIYSLTELNKIFYGDNNNLLKDIAEKSIEIFIDGFNKNGDVGRFTGEFTESNLEDNAYILLGLIGLFEITAKPKYIIYAVKIANYMIKYFYDKDKGGFYDIRQNSKRSSIGFLNFREKSILDYSSYSANSISLLGIAKLYSITSDNIYKTVILKSYEYFANDAYNFKNNSSGFIVSIMHYLAGINKNILVGSSKDKSVAEYYKNMLNKQDNKGINPINLFIDLAIDGVLSEAIIENYTKNENLNNKGRIADNTDFIGLYSNLGKDDMPVFKEIISAINEYNKECLKKGNKIKGVLYTCSGTSCNIIKI